MNEEGGDLNKALKAIRDYRREEEGWPWEQTKAVIEDNPNSPWLIFEFVWVVAYVAELPDSWTYAVWRKTGVVHRVVGGVVQDPALFAIPWWSA